MDSQTPGLESTTPRELERLVAACWTAHGWQTTMSPVGADNGVDVLAHRPSTPSQTALIQVKQRDSGRKLTTRDVREYAGLYRLDDRIDAVVLLTTSTFTTPARTTATHLDVTLGSRSTLHTLRETAVERYTSQTLTWLTTPAATPIHETAGLSIRTAAPRHTDTSVDTEPITQSATDRTQQSRFLKQLLAMFPHDPPPDYRMVLKLTPAPGATDYTYYVLTPERATCTIYTPSRRVWHTLNNPPTRHTASQTQETHRVTLSLPSDHQRFSAHAGSVLAALTPRLVSSLVTAVALTPDTTHCLYKHT